MGDVTRVAPWLHDPITTQILASLARGEKVPNAVAREVTLTNRVTVWRRIRQLADEGVIDLRPLGERIKVASARWGALTRALKVEYTSVYKQTREAVMHLLSKEAPEGIKSRAVLASLVERTPASYVPRLLTEERVRGVLRSYASTGRGGIGLAPLVAIHMLFETLFLPPRLPLEEGEEIDTLKEKGFWVVVGFAYTGPIVEVFLLE